MKNTGQITRWKIKILKLHSSEQQRDIVVGVESIHKLSTNISYTLFDEYTNLILNNKMMESVNIFYRLHHEGYSVMDILDNYFTYIKITTLLNEDVKYKLTILVCKYIIHFHNIHEDELELAFFTNNFIKTLHVL